MTRSEFAADYNALLNDCIDFFTDKIRIPHPTYDFSPWDNDDEPEQTQNIPTFAEKPVTAKNPTNSGIVQPVAKTNIPTAAKSKTLEMIETGRKILKCQSCPLHKNSAARFPGCGSVASKIFLIAEPVTPMEEKERYAVSGASRAFFDKWLSAIGLSEDDLFVTNILKCCLGNTRPSVEMIDTCREHLNAQIELVNPKVIVTLGQLPLSSLKRAGVNMAAEHGVPVKYNGRTVLPLFSPAFVLANPAYKAPLWEDLKKLKSMLESS
ncbi:MAG: uracil-DNA glycosylase [Spirochaetota bacterium]|jgi:DNA polymerase|nr:uracil-DNA glycosylase [Spirochaetota bacterium]